MHASTFAAPQIWQRTGAAGARGTRTSTPLRASRAYLLAAPPPLEGGAPWLPSHLLGVRRLPSHSVGVRPRLPFPLCGCAPGRRPIVHGRAPLAAVPLCGRAPGCRHTLGVRAPSAAPAGCAGCGAVVPLRLRVRSSALFVVRGHALRAAAVPLVWACACGCAVLAPPAAGRAPPAQCAPRSRGVPCFCGVVWAAWVLDPLRRRLPRVTPLLGVRPSSGELSLLPPWRTYLIKTLAEWVSHV